MSTHAYTVCDATSRVITPKLSSAEDALDWYAAGMTLADYCAPPEFGGPRAEALEVRIWTWRPDGSRVERTVTLTA